jgi:lipoate-protein ligase A
MAVDEALLRLLPQSGVPVLRLYRWDRSAVSLGYFQEAQLAPKERAWVRRYTGGGLVDHAADVTYTVVAPRSHPWLGVSVPESYATIHKGVQAALTAIGIRSIMAPTCLDGDSPACFQKPVRFDLIPQEPIEGFLKLSGAAQRRTREGLLQQGSILVPREEQRQALYRKFAQTFAGELGISLKHGELTAEEEEKACALEKERYGTAAWNAGE